MAVAFRALTQGDSFSTTLPINKPAGVVNGDLLIAQIIGDGTSITITAPAGWALLEGPIASGASATLWVYYKLASSEPTSWTWTASAGLNWVGDVLAYSGVSTTSPINAHANTLTTAGVTSITGAAVTTTVSNCFILGLFAVRATPFPGTAGAGFTERAEITSTNLSSLVGYSEDEAITSPATVSPTATMTGSGGSGWAAVTVAIAPPSLGPTNTVAPAVSGVTQVGQTVTCSTGTWV